MNLALVYHPGRIGRLNARDDGLKSAPPVNVHRLSPRVNFRPTEFFYGAFELRDRGHGIGLFEAVERPRRSIPKFLAEHLLKMKYLPVKTYTAIIDATWFLLDDLAPYDVVIATTPGIAFSLAIWKALGFFDRPIAAIQCGILNYDLNRIRVVLTRYLLGKMTTQLYGIGELAEIRQVYRVDPDRVDVNCFGVDTRFWTPAPAPAPPTHDYILAVGNDAGRDFDTLMDAARGVAAPVVVVTKRPLPSGVPDNVTVIRGAWNSRELDDAALRDLYRGAMAVAVPLKPNLQPSGQSVTLQAMACAKPVILTRTAGLWENDHLGHMGNVVFVQPGRPEQWVDAIDRLTRDPALRRRIGSAARNYALDHGEIRQFALRMEQICRKAYAQSRKIGH